jgi:hypothetical protein
MHFVGRAYLIWNVSRAGPEINFRMAQNYRPIGLDRSFQRKRSITKRIGW